MNNSIFRKNLYLMHKKGDVRNNYDDPDLRDWEGSTSKISNSGATGKSSSSGHWENYDSGEPYSPPLIDKRSPSEGGGTNGSSGSWTPSGRNNYSSSGSSSGLPSTPWSNTSGTASRQSSGGNTSIGSNNSYKTDKASGNTNQRRFEESYQALYSPLQSHQKTNKYSSSGSNSSISGAPWTKSTKSEGSSYTPPSSGWGKEGSQEFKDNKKAYNQWYYQQNKDYWRNYYGTKSAMTGDPRYSAPSNNTTSAMKGDPRYSAPTTYGNAMKGDPRYSVQNTSSPSYANAMQGDPRYATPTMRVSDLIKQRKSAISAGNDYIESHTGTVGNESLIENMWKSGVRSIIKAGKSFLNAWKSGFGF